MKNLNKNICPLIINPDCVAEAGLGSGKVQQIPSKGVIVVHRSKMTVKQLLQTIQNLTDYKEELLEQLLVCYEDYIAEFGVYDICDTYAEKYPRRCGCDRDCEYCGRDPEECGYYNDTRNLDPVLDFYTTYEEEFERITRPLSSGMLHPKLFQDLVSERVCLSTFADMLDENEIAYE